MDYKKQITQFANRAHALCGKLALATKSEVIYADVTALCSDMEKSIENCSDEMFYTAVYNSRATIMTAPKNCSVGQLKEALNDACEELRLICEYLDN